MRWWSNARIHLIIHTKPKKSKGVESDADSENLFRKIPTQPQRGVTVVLLFGKSRTFALLNSGIKIFSITSATPMQSYQRYRRFV